MKRYIADYDVPSPASTRQRSTRWPEIGTEVENWRRTHFGCWMHDSVDGQLTHDQGYLLVEDLYNVPVVQARRFTTMKSFRFAEAIDNMPVAMICPFWSLAAALLMHACMGVEHEGPVG